MTELERDPVNPTAPHVHMFQPCANLVHDSRSSAIRPEHLSLYPLAVKGRSDIDVGSLVVSSARANVDDELLRLISGGKNQTLLDLGKPVVVGQLR